MADRQPLELLGAEIVDRGDADRDERAAQLLHVAFTENGDAAVLAEAVVALPGANR